MSKIYFKGPVVKTVLGIIVIPLWCILGFKLFLVHVRNVDKDIQRLYTEQGIEYALQNKPNMVRIKELPIKGMSRGEVTNYMKGYWFIIPNYINDCDGYFYKRGLLPVGYDVCYSVEGKFIGLDQGWMTPPSVILAAVSLAPEARSLLNLFWVLKWITILYMFWVFLPLIDKWRHKPELRSVFENRNDTTGKI